MRGHIGTKMSRAVEKLIEQEDQHILWMLHNNEAIYVQACYQHDEDGKLLFNKESMRKDFEDSMETLISLNEQKRQSPFWKEPPQPIAPEGFKKMRWPEDFDSKH